MSAQLGTHCVLWWKCFWKCQSVIFSPPKRMFDDGLGANWVARCVSANLQTSFFIVYEPLFFHPTLRTTPLPSSDTMFLEMSCCSFPVPHQHRSRFVELCVCVFSSALFHLFCFVCGHLVAAVSHTDRPTEKTVPLNLCPAIIIRDCC